MARRWKTQFNENAKALAFFEVLPEALHNAVEAFGASPEYAGTADDGPGRDSMTLLLRPGAAGRIAVEV